MLNLKNSEEQNLLLVSSPNTEHLQQSFVASILQTAFKCKFYLKAKVFSHFFVVHLSGGLKGKLLSGKFELKTTFIEICTHLQSRQNRLCKALLFTFQ